MTTLSLFLLGLPRIEQAGVPLEMDTRKAVALLSYLAVTGQPHSRDSLANLLWPDYDQSNARAALRRTLSALNKALGANWLNISREKISLVCDADVWLDVAHFKNYLEECRRTHPHSASQVCSACLTSLTQAAALYKGDFMAGFNLRDSPNFEEWQFFQAESLRRDYASVLERLVQGFSALENFEVALTYCQHWLGLDRLHEVAHQQLMQLYEWSGQRARALRQYRECVQVLEQELGVAPLELTTKLYQAIKENKFTTKPPQIIIVSTLPAEEKALKEPSSSTTDPPVLISSNVDMQPSFLKADYPLVGRSAEWSVLLKTYEASYREEQIIIITGEAGIGKTRLVEEFLKAQRAKAKRGIITQARCFEGETNLAYGLIVAILRTAISQKKDSNWLEKVKDNYLSEVARLIPELAQGRSGLLPAPSLDNPGAQSRFFEGLRQIFVSLFSEQPPGLLFFDDLHWADNASLELLIYLVRRLREQPLCMVLSWREANLTRNHKLHQLAAEIQRYQSATTLPLSRLSRKPVQELVLATKLDLTPEKIDHLYQETEGLPIFLVEYLNALANGLTNLEQNNWSLPGGVRDLLHSHLARISEAGGQLLSAAAVMGRSFDFDILREVSGRGEEEAITALEELISQGLVKEVASTNPAAALIYDFSHEKLRNLVYEETSLARRRLLHRRVAESLLNQGRVKQNLERLASQIALHYQLAGNEASAAEYFKKAGDYARALYANSEALSHLQTALALSYPDTAILHEAIGDLYTLQGEYNQAFNSYEAAAAMTTTDSALARLEHKLGSVYARRGDWELAESHFQMALANASQAELQARIYADWSLSNSKRGLTAPAQQLAERAMELALITNNTQAVALVHNLLGLLASHRGDLEKACYHLENSLRSAEQLTDPTIRTAALNNLAQVYSAMGITEHAIALSEKALALSHLQGDRHHEAALHNNLADLLHVAGRTEEAMLHLKQSVSIYTEIGIEAGTIQPAIWKLADW